MFSRAVLTAAPVEVALRPVLARALAAWLRAVSAAICAAGLAAAEFADFTDFAEIVPASALVAWVGLKFFNVFGPNEYHKGEMMSLVVKNYRDVAAGRTIRLFKSHRPDYADGEQRRDFVYVKDCAAVMLWLWRQSAGANISGIYNLGSGEARTFLDLMNATGAALGVAPNIEFIDIPPALRPSYQYFTEAKMGRLRAAGYNAPFTPLEDAVRDCITNHLAQSDDPYL
jgi:ADP-L-glycero-D-manno-heptose 6-epimerase